VSSVVVYIHETLFMIYSIDFKKATISTGVVMLMNKDSVVSKLLDF
jgi:hypothetical protein